MRIVFEIKITEDIHRVRLTKKLLDELGQDVAVAVSGHEAIEENAVECIRAFLAG